jgi:hypothetical protein
VHAYHRTDRALRRGDRRLAQLARPAALADPRRRRADRAVGCPDLGLALEPDDIAEAQLRQEGEQFGIGKVTVSTNHGFFRTFDAHGLRVQIE